MGLQIREIYVKLGQPSTTGRSRLNKDVCTWREHYKARNGVKGPHLTNWRKQKLYLMDMAIDFMGSDLGKKYFPVSKVDKDGKMVSHEEYESRRDQTKELLAELFLRQNRNKISNARFLKERGEVSDSDSEPEHTCESDNSQEEDEEETHEEEPIQRVLSERGASANNRSLIGFDRLPRPKLPSFSKRPIEIRSSTDAGPQPLSVPNERPLGTAAQPSHICTSGEPQSRCRRHQMIDIDAEGEEDDDIINNNGRSANGQSSPKRHKSVTDSAPSNRASVEGSNIASTTMRVSPVLPIAPSNGSFISPRAQDLTAAMPINPTQVISNASQCLQRMDTTLEDIRAAKSRSPISSLDLSDLNKSSVAPVVAMGFKIQTSILQSSGLKSSPPPIPLISPQVSRQSSVASSGTGLTSSSHITTYKGPRVNFWFVKIDESGHESRKQWGIKSLSDQPLTGVISELLLRMNVGSVEKLEFVLEYHKFDFSALILANDHLGYLNLIETFSSLVVEKWKNSREKGRAFNILIKFECPAVQQSEQNGQEEDSIDGWRL